MVGGSRMQTTRHDISLPTVRSNEIGGKSGLEFRIFSRKIKISCRAEIYKLKWI
jgi:hypothetical protein